MASAPLLAERDGKDDDAATSDELLAEFESHEDQSVVDEADHQGANDGADHGCPAAKEAGATEHRCCDDRKFVALAELEAAGLQAPRISS
jgi:hypothetical protein